MKVELNQRTANQSEISSFYQNIPVFFSLPTKLKFSGLNWYISASSRFSLGSLTNCVVMITVQVLTGFGLLGIQNGKSETGEFLYIHENSRPNCDDDLLLKIFILNKCE